MYQKIALIITGIFIGLFAVSQYQSITLGPFRDQYQPGADRDIIVKNLNQDQKALKNQIAELRSRIREAQQSEGVTSETEQGKILKKLEKKNGLIPLSGRGIEIVLDDSPEAKRAFLDVNDNSLVHAADLRDVVNLLFAYGADAVAINGERIIATSPITCVGNNILVNHSNLVPPFRIESLGPAEQLYLNLLNTQELPSLYGRKESYGLTFTIAVKDVVRIPVYGSNFPLENLKEVAS